MTLIKLISRNLFKICRMLHLTYIKNFFSIKLFKNICMGLYKMIMLKASLIIQQITEKENKVKV